MIKAIWLDLGNVVVFFDRQRVSRAFAKLLGRPFADVDRIVNGSEGMALLEQFERGKINSGQYRRELTHRLGARILAQKFWEVYDDIFTCNKGMLDLISQLPLSVKLIAFSNTDPHRFRWIVKITKLRFHRVVTSYKVGAMKPEASMYDVAIRKAGVPPSEILYFDDVLAYCEAAQQYGIRTHHFHTAKLAARELKRRKITR
ncbi:MAG: HAD family phosphatase [Patescibacteria group bacterium]